MAKTRSRDFAGWQESDSKALAKGWVKKKEDYSHPQFGEARWEDVGEGEMCWVAYSPDGEESETCNDPWECMNHLEEVAEREAVSDDEIEAAIKEVEAETPVERYAIIERLVESGSWGELIADMATVASKKGDDKMAKKLRALNETYSDH